MDRKTRIEENEKLFREVNERVERLQDDLQAAEPRWVCECGDETCFEKLAVPLGEYHEVRAHDDWFLIKPDHAVPDVEQIVTERGSYLVVEKIRL